MAPTTDYKIILEQIPTVLAEKVKEALQDGWQVYGGVTVINNSWAQALVKTEPLLAQILAQLKTINTNTANTATNTANTASNTSTTNSRLSTISSTVSEINGKLD